MILRAMFDVIFKGESPFIGSETAARLLHETGTTLGRDGTPLDILRYRADFHALAASLTATFGEGVGIPRSPQRSQEGKQIFTLPILEIFTFQLPEVEPEISHLKIFVRNCIQQSLLSRCYLILMLMLLVLLSRKLGIFY